MAANDAIVFNHHALNQRGHNGRFRFGSRERAYDLNGRRRAYSFPCASIFDERLSCGARRRILSIDRLHGQELGSLGAALRRAVSSSELARHVQLVLTDRTPLTEGQNFGVLLIWRLADLEQSMRFCAQVSAWPHAAKARRGLAAFRPHRA